MELFLFRHGSAESAEAAGGDENRALTERGRDDARAVARALKRAAAAPEIILTSPLVRARQTGDLLAQALEASSMSDDRLRPGLDLAALRELCSEQGCDRLLIVGHEPDLSTLARELTGARVKLRAGGVARIVLDAVAPDQGVLHWLLSADLLAD